MSTNGEDRVHPRRVGILGHRGARGLLPENSLAGFRKAIALGVDIIEFDVHQSRDGQPVVIHDVLLDRTTTGKGPVPALTADELGRIRLRDAGSETLFTLDRMLAELGPQTVTLGLEVKTGVDAAPYPGFPAQIVDVLRRHDALARTMFISFVPETLEALHALAPEAGKQACVWRAHTEMQGGLRRAIARFLEIPGCILAVQEEMLALNEALCRELIPADQLAVGVHNDPDRIAYWLAGGVRHLSTDRPDIALELRRRSEEPHA